LFRIILSPDAGSREVYKKIKGKDYFETTWFNIKKYVEETSGNVEVKFILEKGNIDDVDNMINMCLKTGVNKVHLSMDVNISETEFYKYESSFSHFVNRCKNEGINLLSIFTFVPEQIKNKVSNLSTE
jgi:molybdenum cofactor biosynthesis enzyme MoaA